MEKKHPTNFTVVYIVGALLVVMYFVVLKILGSAANERKRLLEAVPKHT